MTWFVKSGPSGVSSRTEDTKKIQEHRGNITSQAEKLTRHEVKN